MKKTFLLIVMAVIVIGACGNQIANTLEGNEMSADKINAGRLSGVNVVSASHMTQGTYTTAALSGGESTVNVKDTTDFPSSGSGWFIDTTNDRDAFSWTGKTANSLTGCSGVLAHNDGALVIPQAKNIVIAGNVNEMRFYGDRGDGTIEELANIGIRDADNYAGYFGSPNANNVGLIGSSDDNIGVYGWTNTDRGVQGYADGSGGIGVQGSGSSATGIGVKGYSYSGKGVVGQSAEAYSVYCEYYSGMKAPLVIQPSDSASAPTHTAEKGSLVVTSAGVLYINTDGSTTWQKVGAQ